MKILFIVFMMILNQIGLTQSIDSIDFNLYKDLESNLTTKGGKVNIGYTYYTNCWALTSANELKVKTLAKFLDIYRGITIRLESYMDCRGMERYNQLYSERIGENIMRSLIYYGIDKDRISNIGYGENCHLIECENCQCTDEIHAFNRRVEVISLSVDTFEVNYDNKMDGKYYTLDREKCKGKDYWDCFSGYSEVTYDEGFIIGYIPHRLSYDCGSMFKVKGDKLILGGQTSFELILDTILIEAIMDESIKLSSEKYSDHLLYLKPISNIDVPKLTSKINSIIDIEKNKGFLNFNKAVLEEGIFTEEEIVSALIAPDFEAIIMNEINLSWPKKWYKKIKKEASH